MFGAWLGTAKEAGRTTTAMRKVKVTMQEKVNEAVKDKAEGAMAAVATAMAAGLLRAVVVGR